MPALARSEVGTQVGTARALPASLARLTCVTMRLWRNREASYAPGRNRTCGKFPPELPRNLKLGQIRRTAGIVTQGEWNSLTRDDQEAVDALSWQIVWRCRQKRHPSLEGEACIFLTVRHVQRLLRAIGARKTGEKAAAAAIATMQAKGWIEDTGGTKKPRRGEQSAEGGKDSQPDLQHAYWWRIFRVPALSRLVVA